MKQGTTDGVYWFDVLVTRIGYGTRTIRVEADDEGEAQQAALDVAGNEDFNEHGSDYILTNYERSVIIKEGDPDCEGIVESLMGHEKILPTLLGIHDDLDRLIGEKLNGNQVEAG